MQGRVGKIFKGRNAPALYYTRTTRGMDKFINIPHACLLYDHLCLARVQQVGGSFEDGEDEDEDEEGEQRVIHGLFSFCQNNNIHFASFFLRAALLYSLLILHRSFSGFFTISAERLS